MTSWTSLLLFGSTLFDLFLTALFPRDMMSEMIEDS